MKGGEHAVSNNIEKPKLSETSALPKGHGTSIKELEAKAGAGKDGRGGGTPNPKSEKAG